MKKLILKIFGISKNDLRELLSDDMKQMCQEAVKEVITEILADKTVIRSKKLSFNGYIHEVVNLDIINKHISEIIDRRLNSKNNEFIAEYTNIEKKRVNSEKFIDDIVDRIVRKQLSSGGTR